MWLFYFFCEHATVLRVLTATLACAEKGNVAEPARTGWRDSLSAMSILRAAVTALAIVDLTNCATTPQHQFTEPAGSWQVRSGQLLYRAPATTLIGDVIIRSSKSGDFELDVFKRSGRAIVISAAGRRLRRSERAARAKRLVRPY